MTMHQVMAHEPEAVTYATPVPRTGARVWAGVAIILAGLALVVLGGCFLIGVMLTVNRGFTALAGSSLTQSQLGLVFILYVLALASFVGAVWLMVAGVRGLLHVMRG